MVSNLKHRKRINGETKMVTQGQSKKNKIKKMEKNKAAQKRHRETETERTHKFTYSN